MVVASYLQCKSSPGVSRDFAILGSRLEQFEFLKTTHNYPLHGTGLSGLHVFDHRAQPARERER